MPQIWVSATSIYDVPKGATFRCDKEGQPRLGPYHHASIVEDVSPVLCGVAVGDSERCSIWHRVITNDSVTCSGPFPWTLQYLATVADVPVMFKRLRVR